MSIEGTKDVQIDPFPLLSCKAIDHYNSLDGDDARRQYLLRIQKQIDDLCAALLDMVDTRSGSVTIPDTIEAAVFFCATGGRSKQVYRDYLKSRHWKLVREIAVKVLGPACNRCGGAEKPVDIHHLTYETIGRERLKDLEVLCRDCHRSEHGFRGKE